MRAATTSARLLVVDDEATILELLSGSLRLAGFEVVTAASGGEAVRAAAAITLVRSDAPRTAAHGRPGLKTAPSRRRNPQYVTEPTDRVD